MIVRFLDKNVSPYLQLDIFSNIVPSSNVYGLAKWIRKTTLIPVVSMIGTDEYNCVKYIVKIMNGAMPTTYVVYSTESFVNKISSFDFRHSHFLS